MSRPTTPPELEIRQATGQDLDDFWGDERPKVSMRVLVLRKGGRDVALAGVKFERGRWVAFSDLKPDANLSPITVWRSAMQVEQMILNIGLPVYAVVAGDSPYGNKLVTRMGYHLVDCNDDMELYRKWPKQHS